MTIRTYPLLASRTLSALILAAAGLTACASDDDASNNPYQPLPYDAGLMQDASPIVATGGGGMQQPPAGGGDSGVVTPVMDAGMTTVPMVDTGVVLPVGDAGDAGVVLPMGDAGVTADAGGMARPDQGMGDGKDVICIGDSWMNLDNTVGIQESLLKASMRPFRTFGVPGTKLLDEVIPNQYETAKKQGPVKTVIMTAGGNDVLQDLILLATDCPDESFDDACKKRIDEVAARLQKLWAEMAMDGVTDVLIISYSNKTLGGGYKMVSAYSSQKITPICNSVPAPLRCSSFDTDMSIPNFKDRGDSIHPDNATYDLLGAGVWKLMQEKGMRR